jgi:Flp pilus assembly protein TadD
MQQELHQHGDPGVPPGPGVEFSKSVETGVEPLLDSNRRPWAVAIPLALAVTIAFLPVLGNGFTNFDDNDIFLTNLDYRGLGWKQLAWAWTTFLLGVYQPLSWMLLEAQYCLFGLNPWGYHLTSLLLYVIDTVILYFLVVSLLVRCQPKSYFENSWACLIGAGMATALFAVHPLRTEVVAGATFQPYLPCAMFYMLAVMAYLRAFPVALTPGPPPIRGEGPTLGTLTQPRSPQLVWLVAAWFLFAAGLLSKAVAVSLPFILLILDVYPLRRLGGSRGQWLGRAARRVWLEKVPFAALSLLFMKIAIAARSDPEGLGSVQTNAIGSALAPARQTAQACYGIWFYLVKTVFPTDIRALYLVPDRVIWFESPFLWCILGTIALTAGLFIMRRRWPGVLAVWMIYLVALAPNLGIVKLGDNIAADRYSFVPMVAGVILLAGALSRLWQTNLPEHRGLMGVVRQSLSPPILASTLVRVPVRPMRVGINRFPVGNILIAPLAGVLIFVCTTCTWQQISCWRDSISLWEHEVRVAKNNWAAHSNLGSALQEKGRLDEAVVAFREAIRLNPDLAIPHNNLGFALLKKGPLDDAIAELREAVRLSPSYCTAYNNLGLALEQQGRLNEAMSAFQQAIRVDPDPPAAHHRLAAVLQSRGRFEYAVSELQEAIRLKPNYAEAYNDLGIALGRQGKLAEAAAACREAIHLKPDFSDAYNNLGVALIRQGKVQDAIAAFQEAVRLNPDDARARSNLDRARMAIRPP